MTFTEYLEGIMKNNEGVYPELVAEKLANEVARIFSSEECFFRAEDLEKEGQKHLPSSPGRLTFYPNNPSNSFTSGWSVNVEFHQEHRIVKAYPNGTKKPCTRVFGREFQTIGSEFHTRNVKKEQRAA